MTNLILSDKVSKLCEKVIGEILDKSVYWGDSMFSSGIFFIMNGR